VLFFSCTVNQQCNPEKSDDEARFFLKKKKKEITFVVLTRQLCLQLNCRIRKSKADDEQPNRYVRTSPASIPLEPRCLATDTFFSFAFPDLLTVLFDVTALLIAACFTLVSPQLALAQHTALMALYDVLGLGTKKKKIFFFKQKNNFFSLFRLFSCIVPALCGDCTVLWRLSDMFWEQRDCFVSFQEVCLVCGGLISYWFVSAGSWTAN
jgi:hypothetical protein